ncbi:hypothetical protein J8L98_00220 [Pseudoalteromonas sp. MMG013]|uniref:HEPN domain-containing protein n=1 Tax=Pseudoalteromonas sp. MMG013 TaxID=2822687 RepID=UPI001B38B8BB|nr:HEPN domain-containing protein [Pseudoalteromonas sp. MMG013]MBQ4860113.1 hypothetical protein [Pseudoalteromonas sp. MMG013]
MPSAKTDFIERIRCLNISVQSQAVQNRPLSEREHNSIARMLRNGLAVVSFAALEDFIKKRSSEAMAEISRCSIAFTALPEKLQKAATYEALNAISYQLSLLDKEDKASYVQTQASKIASTATTHYELSDHTFAYSQANVNGAVIGDILKSFNVEDPWRQMSTISSGLGLTGLLLAEAYRNAATRRHRAAHVASADTPPNDILQFVKEAFAIAISFDALLSKSIQKFRENEMAHLNGTIKLNASAINTRVLKNINNTWKEFSNNNTRAYRTSNDLQTLQTDCKRRASTAKQLYVEFDDQGLIIDWECY